ncbi:hypothetical protein AD948_00630 [Acetobacter senegalensis]|uniref:Helix-turn-helix domain-containing protein n=1 Tax=Acetobacter senegalensis TaxID=446692 RepID=A0A149U8C8_9PROT|nr:hypothetical protein AD948_00630 [Acetobacter senegalensis]
MRYASAAAYIGLATGTLRNQHEKLEMPSIKIGSVRCFRILDLEDFLVRKFLETECRSNSKTRRGRGESAVLSVDMNFWVIITLWLILALVRLY